MLLTAIVLLIVPAIFMRSLRRVSYITHVSIVIVAAWALSPLFPAMYTLSENAVYSVFAIHLISINIITFALCYFQKNRNPLTNDTVATESSIYRFILLGGSFGAILGRRQTPQSPIKVSSRIKFWIIFALQVSALTLLGIRYYS